MEGKVDEENNDATQRNAPGIPNSKWFKWDEVPLENMDSTFGVQQYLQQVIRQDPSNIDAICKLPPGQDKAVWQYEHLRQLSLELTQLACELDPVCTKDTCPQMKADEWQYLCAAHKTPQECCAIDYIIHTLDGTSSLLNSNKWFPSRVSIPQNSLKSFPSIARRLYRLFAHAYFSHRDVFDAFEDQTHLCDRFVRISTDYKLIPPKLLIIPRKK